MATAYEIIREAIQKKLVIKAFYKNHPREMCPHAIGTKNGRQKAMFYQFGGSSDGGLGPDGSAQNWRCFFVEDMSNVSSEPGSWHTASDHSRRQTCIDRVDVEVSY